MQVTYPYGVQIPPGDITFLELLVGYLGIALNNTRLLGQAWQRANQLETIYRVTDSTLALQPLETTLNAIQERLMSAFNATTCYVALYDSDTQTITFPWLIRHHERISQEPISILDKNSLVAWVVANSQPFISTDTKAEATPVKGISLGESLPRSIIIVPLRDGTNVLGAISIQNDEPHAFDSSEFKTFMAVASHIATIIKNAHLYDQTKNLVNQGTRDYQTAVALRQAIAVISTSLEPSSVLNQLLVALASVIAFDTAYAFINNNDDKLQYVTSRDYHDRPLPVSGYTLQSAWQNSRLITGILESKDAVVISNTAVDSDWIAVDGNETMLSWMGVPLVAERAVVGLLMVHSEQIHAFGDQEKWLATTLCAHTAVALNNARLYQRTQQQLSEISTLYQASATMTANLDQDFVLQTVVTEMVRALKVDSCTIFVWDEHKRQYDAAAHQSILYEEQTEANEPVGLMSVEHLEEYPTLQRLFESKEISNLRQDHTKTQDEANLLEISGMKSILLVPLVRRQKMLGIIAMGQQAQPRTFRQSELWLAQNLAGQAAVAIEHSHLFSQAQRRIEELSTFHSIVLQLNTPLQLNSVLDTITESALKLLVDASNLHIYLYDEATDKYTFGSALWRDGRRQAAVKNIRKKGLTAHVVQNGKPLVINDASSHPLFQSEQANKWGISAIAGFPLKSGNQVIGAFTITYLHPHTFSQDELLLLNLLADQAAVAVKNARLFDDSQRRLRDMSALVDMAKQVTGNLKLNSVLQTTVQILQGLLNARASTITMLSEDGNELVVAAAVGANPKAIKKARMRVGEGISGEALERRELIYIRDAHDEPDFLFFSEVVRSLLVVPLVVRGEAIGTLTVDSDQPNAFSASDIQLMTIAAAQAGVAIANAGLFEEVEERAVELAIAYEELKESDRLKDELVQNVSHELRTPLTFVKGYVDLLLEGEMGVISNEQLEALNIVSTKADEITHLIEDIITLQRIDAGNLQLDETSMTEFLKTAVASHQIVAGQKGLNIVYKKPAFKAMVSMDKNRISQVVDNLIGNAMKFSPDGGVISINVEERSEDVLVTIKDEGIGVPKEKQQKIFERFYQVDGSARRRFGGTGIGLAIVKRIIDAHKGEIWVESEVDEGSKFYFTLPRIKTAELAESLSDHAQK
jgi:GAF domain-containing protein